ncbi:hypothetical protein NA57DRAFT_78343 [Rhizodiscina lignyota]|uniref:Xylanolytic transcriptional activator regulatory domain-containing protein n=1 Tax=Rhizodiscina lignyota TaxID=1504668 RepID=A0A9P4M4D1_9PEZI|nr:hypothetical protein NA57DRAFT_78343 [Rhizodiscina lignyota]
MVGFPGGNTTVFALAAFVILHVPLIREETERSTAFISTAFRVGQKIGLHRDPQCLDITGVEAELRRRLFWHILHKDALSSTASGLPQMMSNQRQHDTAMPSEYQDKDVEDMSDSTVLSSNSPTSTKSAHSNPHPPPRTTPLGCVDFRALNDTEVDCRQMVCVGRFLITNAIREILQRQLDFTPWSVQDVQHFQGEIERMIIQVRGRIDKLQTSTEEPYDDGATSLQLNNTTANATVQKASVTSWGLEPNSCNTKFLAWSAKLLDLMIEKAYCVLYQPLQKYADRALWLQFREIAISHFHAYIEKYVVLCTEPAFGPFQWIYPGNYQPLQAVSVLLADLAENPKSNEASTSRYLIDSVFSLLEHEGGVVAEHDGHLHPRGLPKAGKAAWKMLWQLRRRALRRMGVDPSVLWASARKHGHEVRQSNASEGSDAAEENMTSGQSLSSLDPLPLEMDGISSLLSAEGALDIGIDYELAFSSEFAGEADPFQGYQWGF